MKKLFAIITALTLLLPMGIPALAAENESKNQSDPVEIPVTGVYKSSVSADTVICVDVIWDAMNFTYAMSRQGAWNTTTHNYGETDTEAGWDKTGKNITVKNHSNTSVDVSFQFDKDEALADKTINGTFTGEGLSDNMVVIATADDDDYRTEVNGVYPCPSKTVQFAISGEKIDNTESTALGTITVSVAEHQKKVTAISVPSERGESIQYWYTEGKGVAPNWSKAQFSVTYDDGSSARIYGGDGSGVEITPVDPNKTLEQYLNTTNSKTTVSYTATYQGKSVEFSVSVMVEGALPSGLINYLN